MLDVADLTHRIDESDRPHDSEVARLAARQHGVVAYGQLLELGVGRGAIERRLALGRLHRVHRGVYAVGHPRLMGRGRWMAAVLACGHDAVLSHQSAGALWGLRPSASTHMDVTTPRGRSVSRGEIRVHHARRLHPDDRTVREEIPVTTVARTLLDLSEVLASTQLQRAFEEADRLRIFDMREIERICKRSRGRRGLRTLGLVLARCRDSAPVTRSELERRFLDLCDSAGLPPPAVNSHAAGMEVDALWPEQRLVVELDGYAFHHTRASFERDRARDAALQLGGYRVLRVTHRRLESDPAAVAGTVQSLLADASGGRSRSRPG